MKELLFLLFPSGSDEKWLADSMECYGYLRNVQDLSSDGKQSMNGDFEHYSKDQ